MLTVPCEPAKASWVAAARPSARMMPASGCSSSVWPSSCASTPATSSAEPARCTRPRVRMIWPPGTANALTSDQSSSTTRAGSGLSEAAAARRWVSRSSAALLAGVSHTLRSFAIDGDDGAAQRRARLLRHHARTALGRMQIEQPQAGDEQRHRGHHGEARLDALPALTRARKPRRTRQQQAREKTDRPRTASPCCRPSGSAARRARPSRSGTLPRSDS